MCTRSLTHTLHRLRVTIQEPRPIRKFSDTSPGIINDLPIHECNGSCAVRNRIAAQDGGGTGAYRAPEWGPGLTGCNTTLENGVCAGSIGPKGRNEDLFLCCYRFLVRIGLGFAGDFAPWVEMEEEVGLHQSPHWLRQDA